MYYSHFECGNFYNINITTYANTAMKIQINCTHYRQVGKVTLRYTYFGNNSQLVQIHDYLGDKIYDFSLLPGGYKEQLTLKTDIKKYLL